MWMSHCRTYSTTQISYGIRRQIKDWWKEGEKERHKEFQSWAEFEHRGFKAPEYMNSWIIEEYGDPSKVLKKDVINVHYEKFRSTYAVHTRVRQAVKNPNDILVKIHAASLNPIDVRMCQGYGRRLLNFRRSGILEFVSKLSKAVQDHTEFPLVLGRDFSGTVVDVGSGVHDIVPGDDIFGTQQVHRLGTLADYASVNLTNVCHKPVSLSHVEAAAVPYVALTTAGALHSFLINKPEGKRALVMGGAGGIGTFSIQYLKAYGVNVTATCSPSSISLCSELGADTCYDYNSPTWKEEIANDARFDLVFDIFGKEGPGWAVNVLNKNGSYSTLKVPLAQNTDSLGLILGLPATASDYISAKMKAAGISVNWGVFRPDRAKLMNVAKMVDSGAVKPVIHKILGFDNVPEGFDLVAAGRTKGKIAINISGLPEATKKPDVEKVIHL